MLEGAALHFVETVEEAAAFMRWLSERRPILGVDTETTGLRPYAGDTLRLVQFGDAKTGWSISYRQWRGLIEQALQLYTGPVVLHNLNFDRHFLTQAGLPFPSLERQHDSMLMDHLLDPARAHALKAVGERYWPGSSAGQYQLDEDKHKNKWDWATIPEDWLSYWSYAAWDPVLTCRIAERHWPQIHGTYLEQYQREVAVQDLAFRLERRGLSIDPVYTSNLLQEWTWEMDALQAELNQLGLDNPSSNFQIAQAMQLTEDWDPDDFTETGAPKVDEKVLKGIDSEISRRVLRFRRLRKWTGSYLATFLRERDADDRVHPSIRTLRARTGRMSITDPALQTLPRGPEIRNCIVAPQGQLLWSIDQANVEVRLFAHLSQDPDLMEAVRAGENLHEFAARQVFQEPDFKKANDIERYTLAKNSQLGMLYGAGPAKIAETAHTTLEAATAFYNGYKERFKGADAIMRTLDTTGRQRLIETGRPFIYTWGGRYSPADSDRIYSLLNYWCQGSASDIFKTMMLELDAAGFGDAMVLPVHDELLFQFPTGDNTSIQDAAKVMTWPDRLTVPLTVGVSGPADRWGALDK